MDDKAAKILRNLQKLPANKRCFNCESLGPGYVVPQFNVFVCTDCSGIHMHTGHRVKSIAMAKFTPEEVKRLQEGGNENIAKSYLARWKPETDTQKPVDRNAKRVQQWIKVVFTDRAYFSEVAPAPVPVEVVSKLEEPPKLVSPTPAPLSRTSPPAPTTPPAQHETSLMDFGPEPVPTSVKTAAPAAAAAAAAADPFDPFATSAPSSAAPASAPAPAFDPFGNSHAAPFNAPPSTSAAPTTSFDPFSTSHATSAAASPAPPAATSGFGSGFDPFNNTASAPWPSAAPAANAPAASDWTSFDTTTAFPTPVSAPVAFTQVVMSHSIGSGPHSGFPSAASTPTASAAMDAFGQHAFGGPTGFGPPAFHPHPAAFHPAAQGGFGGSQFPAAGASDAGFCMHPFSTASSSAPSTPTSAAEKAAAAARNELPSDLFAEPAFPAHAAPYGMPQPPPQMAYMQAHTGGMPAYPQHAAGFGHAGAPHMQQQQQQQQQHMFGNPGQVFAAQGQYAAPPAGFPHGQGMLGYHPQAPGAAGGYTMQGTGSAFPGMQAPPAAYQQPGAHAAFFPQGGAAFPGQQAPQGYGGMPGNPYEASANGFSQQAPTATPAALATGPPPRKPEDLAFADLCDLKKALPKSAGPSTPSYATGGGFGAAAASSGNPFA